MKKAIWLMVALFLVTSLADGVWGGGGRGGGGGGRGGGGARGGGGSRGGASRSSHGSAGRSPSMSRSSGRSSSRSQSRPSTGSTHRTQNRSGSGGSSRHGAQQPNRTRQSVGQPGSSRPGAGGSRPNTGQPGRTQPGTRQPSRTRPQAGQPGERRPSVGQPGGSQRGADRPGERRPSTGQPGTANPGARHRPSSGELGDFLDLPKDRRSDGQLPSTRPADGQRPDGGRRDDKLDRRETTGDNRAGRRDNISDNRQDLIDRRQDRGDQIRDNVPNHLPRWDFWSGSPHSARWHCDHPYRWASAGALTGWFAWDTGTNETYYDYGGDVTYDQENVYFGEEAVASTEQYAEQAIALADTGAQSVELAAPDTEWMPIGVFALTHEEKGDPTLFFQLMVDKDGAIAGTYYNSSKDESTPVQGSVDKKDQRAAWSVGNKQDTVIETGIYNLTQDESTALLHFGTERTQTWLLVRLEEPPEALSSRE